MWVAGRARRCRASTYPRKPMRRCLKIKKAGGISRFLDALFYRNNITENWRCVELTGPTGAPHAAAVHCRPREASAIATRPQPPSPLPQHLAPRTEIALECGGLAAAFTICETTPTRAQERDLEPARAGVCSTHSASKAVARLPHSKISLATVGARCCYQRVYNHRLKVSVKFVYRGLR
jgi:hypothetical protein